MSKGEDITTRYKLDISDLKKGISEANKNIKLANAEFKAASAGMDNWAKSSDGITAKLKQLNLVLNEEKTKLENYKKQQQELDKAYSENGKRADELKAKLAQLASQGVSKTSEEYRKYQKALTDVEKEQQANKKASDDLKITILNQQGTVNKTEKEIKNYQIALKEMQSEENKTATATDELTKDIEKQQNELDDLKSKYKDVVLEQGKDSEEAKKLANKIKELSGELKDSKVELNNASKAADKLDKSLDIDTKTPTDGFTIMKGALASLVADGIRKAIDGIKDFVKETIEVGKKFDSSMSQVEAVSGASGEALEKLRSKAKEMGETTKFSASDAADAFNYMAMAGWKTEDMLNGIEGVLNLAAASGTDLATTSDIVTDALTAMGYSAGDAGKLADVMAAASSNANTNVEMMGATFQYAAPIVGALGYNMEDTAVAIGLMANAGIKGEKAGTALRSMLTRLSAPPKECASAMDALGISITNTDGTMKPLNEIMGDLRKSFDGLGEAEQAQYAKQIAGQEAMSGLLSIVNAAPEDFDKLTKAVNDSAGAAQKMSDTMQDNLEGDMTKLNSSIEGLQIALYEKFEPALRKGVEALTKLVNNKPAITALTVAIGALISAFVVTKIVSFVTSMQTAITAMKSWQLLTKAVTAAQWLLNAAMSANPIGIVIAIIAGLVAAFVTLWNKSEKFRNFWIGLWEKIKEVVSPVINYITDRFKLAWEVIKIIWDSVSSYFKLVFDSIKTVFSAIGDIFSGDFSSAWEKIKGIFINAAIWFKEHVLGAIGKIFSNIDQFMTDHFGEAWTNIKNIFGAVGEWFAEKFTKVKDSIVNIFTGIRDFFITIWNATVLIWSTVAEWFNNNVVEPIKNFFSPLVEWFTKLFKSIWDYISSVFKVIAELAQGCWNAIVLVWGIVSDWFNEHIVQPLVNFFTILWNTISTTAQNAWNFIVSVWTVVSTWFNENIITPVKTFFTELWNGIQEKATATWEGIKEIWNIVSTWFSETIIEPVKNTFIGLWETLKTGASSAWEGIKGVFSTVANFFRDTFQSAWQKVKDVFSVGGKIFDGIKEGIVNAFKTVVNGIIRGINKVITIPFNGINNALDKIQSIDIAGAKPFSGLVSRISVPQIPELEHGIGLAKKGHQYLLEGNGNEAVVPLDKNGPWVKSIANELISQLPALKNSITNNTNSITNSNNFTQIINAPKQLSRIEIYRQTKNLLEYKGG